MAQFRVGKASVSHGQQTVSFEDANLSSTDILQAGDLFSLSGENVWYEIASVAISNSKLTQLVLSTPYASTTKSDRAFAIHRSFSPNLGLPLTDYGDINTAALFQQSLSTLDSALALLSAGPLSGTASPIFKLRQNVESALAERSGLSIHRQGLSPIELVYTGDQTWKRWSFGAEDVETNGRLTIGRELEAGERMAVAGNATIDGDLFVHGNLYLRGDTTIIDATNLEIEDPVIKVGRGNTGALPYLGLQAERGGNDAFFVWDEAADRFTARYSVDDLATLGDKIDIEARNFYGTLIGRADSALKLDAARMIELTGDATGSVSFDGSQNVGLALNLADTGVGAGTFTKITVDAKGRAIAGSQLVLADVTTALGFTPFGPSDASSANIANKLIRRDATGAFSATTISADTIAATTFTGSLIGIAQQAGRLAALRQIAVIGDATGSIGFDGSANVQLPLVLAETGVGAGTYANLVINAKGQITGARNLNSTDIDTALGYSPLSSQGGIVNGALTVAGDLLVQGTLTTTNTETIVISSPIITVAEGNASASIPYAGIKIERGTLDAYLVWNETSDRLVFGLSTGDLATNFTHAPIQASAFHGALVGNADTASKLATARMINGQSFDGSANISFNSDAVAEGTSNLFFTTDRARAALSGSNGVLYDPVTGNIQLANFDTPVLSVAGKTGDVLLEPGDVGGLTDALSARAMLTGATFLGKVSVRPSSGVGSVSLMYGTSTTPGAVEFHTSDDVRRGYIGLSDGISKLRLAAESGWGWEIIGTTTFTSTPKVNGHDVYHAGNFAAANYAPLTGAIFSGAVSAPTLTSSQKSGVNGGALFLSTPASGHTLNGTHVVVDVNGNRLQVYESGSPYRGVYIDLTTCQSQSQIWHSGTFNPATKANLASPALTGSPTAPTPAAGNNSTQIATTAFVANELTAKASLSGAAFTSYISAAGVITSSGVNAMLSVQHRDNAGMTSGLYATGGAAYIWNSSAGHLLSMPTNGNMTYLGRTVWDSGNFTPSSKMNVAGGTFNGNIAVETSWPSLGLKDTTTGVTRNIVNTGNVIGLTKYDGSYAMHVNDAGAIWSLQMGDLNTYISNKAWDIGNERAGAHASLRVAKTGDTMTGNLSINKTYPFVAFFWGGVKHSRWILNNDGSMCLQDGDNGQNHFTISPTGVVWTQQFGDLNTHIENRAYAWGINGRDQARSHADSLYNSAVSVANDRVHRVQMSGYGEVAGTGGWVHVQPGVFTGALGTLYGASHFAYRTLQMHVPSLGGWVNIWVG